MAVANSAAMLMRKYAMRTGLAALPLPAGREVAATNEERLFGQAGFGPAPLSA